MHWTNVLVNYIKKHLRYILFATTIQMGKVSISQAISNLFNHLNRINYNFLPNIFHTGITSIFIVLARNHFLYVVLMIHHKILFDSCMVGKIVFFFILILESLMSKSDNTIMYCTCYNVPYFTTLHDLYCFNFCTTLSSNTITILWKKNRLHCKLRNWTLIRMYSLRLGAFTSVQFKCGLLCIFFC